jgi:peptidoglycan/LPS O-acetylase OafA/YrhL
MKHIDILDGLRAYAILMVCVAHFFQVNESSLYQSHPLLGVLLFKLSQLGLTGVELFFLLSGFLITNILLDSKNSRNYYRVFFARRVLRIFPLYYFVLFVSFFIIPEISIPDTAGRDVIANQWWLWTYLSNMSFVFDKPKLTWDGSANFPHFGHFWSLAVEEHFYLVWPFVIYRCKNSWLPYIMLGLVGCSVIVVCTYWWPFNNYKILGWGTLRQVGTLALGGWIALQWREPESFKRWVCRAKIWVLPATVFFLLQTFIPRYMEFKPIARQLACLTLYPAIMILALAGNKMAAKFFCHRILYFVGKISYGIYIYHGWLRPYFKEYIYSRWLSDLGDGVVIAAGYTVVCTVLSIGMAWVSWSVIESPILKLKKLFLYSPVESK